LQRKDGTQLATRAVPAPTGKLWATFNCASHASWRQFVIRYLRDAGQVTAPDYNYKASPGTVAITGVPARVCDACQVLSDAYGALSGPSWFNDPANTPSLPMDVWMQPWADSKAGNVSNWLRVSTRTLTFDDFRADVAHEMAHRFQHQYSMGYWVDMWYHDASAGYLAQRLYTDERDVAAYVGENGSWISDGGVTWSAWGGGYGAASFIGYLADQHGINAAQLWVKGATGVGEFSSWEDYIDRLLRAKPQNATSLSEAWAGFARAYVVDHSLWGRWTNDRGQAVPTEAVLGLGSGGGFKGYKREFTGRIRLMDPKLNPSSGYEMGLYGWASIKGAYYLSAGGEGITWTGQEITTGQGKRQQAATIAARVDSRAGQGWFGLVAGSEPTGCAALGACKEIERISKDGRIAGGRRDFSYRVGDTAGTFIQAPNFNGSYLARIAYWYSDWSSSPLNSNSISIEAWAIPELLGVERLGAQTGAGTNPSSGQSNKLRWKPSPLENEKDFNGNAIFGRYQIIGVDKAGKTVILQAVVRKGSDGLTTTRVKNPDGSEEDVYELDLGTLNSSTLGGMQKIGVQTIDYLGTAGPEAWAEQAFLTPGVWNMGQGFPREVALRYEGSELVTRYAAPDGTQHRVVFKPATCSTAGQAICFQAFWDKPNSLQCTKWNYLLVGESDDGKSFDGLYTNSDDCIGTDTNGRPMQNDPNYVWRAELKGTWLRKWDGGQVDGSYPPVPAPSLPSGNNPFGNYKPSP
jgi:hypothetical protein